MKFIIILFIYFITLCLSFDINSSNNSNSNSNENTCKLKFTTISEVNPYEIGSLVEIQGSFCVNNLNVDGFSVSFITVGGSNGDNQFNCVNITVEDINTTTSNNQVLKCALENGLSPIDPFNFNEFATVKLKTPNTIFEIDSYLFTYNSCPVKCQDHGICGASYICLCNKDYVSFDCSHKIKNDTIISPTGTSYNSFKMTTTKETINVKMSNILVNISSSSNVIEQQQESIDSLYVTKETSTSNGLSFTVSEGSNWISSLFYNVDYLVKPNQQSKSSFINFNGNYLPISTSTALVSIFQTINSTFILNNMLNNTQPLQLTFSAIFEISNSKDTMKKLSWEISKTENSILFRDLKTNSLLLISLSDLYAYGTLIPDNTKLKLLSDETIKSLSLSNSSSSTSSPSSIFLSIEFEQPTFITMTDEPSFQVQLTFNVYNTPPIVLPGWAIALIVFASVSGFGFLVLVIVLFIRARTKKYHLKKKTLDLDKLSINNENQPLIKNTTDDSSI